MTIFLSGLVFSLFRHRLKPLPFHWWVLFVIPIGLDGGTQLISPFFQVFPAWGLIGFALVVALLLSWLIFKKADGRWQLLLFVWFFPLGMTLVYLNGPRLSTWYLRTITGFIFGFGNLWLAFPVLQAEFSRIEQNLASRLTEMDDLEGGSHANPNTAP